MGKLRAWLFGMATLALTGCASAADQAYSASKTCEKAGFVVGTEHFQTCLGNVADYREERRQRILAGLAAMGQALRDTPQAPSAPPTPVGFTQVCMYDTLTGPRAITISATAICPLMLPQ